MNSMGNDGNSIDKSSLLRSKIGPRHQTEIPRCELYVNDRCPFSRERREQVRSVMHSLVSFLNSWTTFCITHV